MTTAYDSSEKQELPPLVQELIKTKPKHVPERYIYHSPNNSSADDQAEITYMDSPTIDLSVLSNTSSHQHDEELRKFLSLLSSWGCLQLVNHGLSSSILDQIREVTKQFFDSPLEMKQRHSRTLDWFEGYGGDSASENQSYNWNDKLHLRVYPVEKRNFKFWPEYIPNFRETLEEYITEQKRVIETIMKAIAKSLNLEENRIFSASGGKESMNMSTRFNYYPPCSSPEQVLGLKPHSSRFFYKTKKLKGYKFRKIINGSKFQLFLTLCSNFKVMY